MATRESRREVKDLIEGLEYRVHRGPPINFAEIHSARDFLRENDFSPASDYFNRLVQIQSRLDSRSALSRRPAEGKRNYGGEAAGVQMQVQSIYDHLILSTCYGGEFNGKRGRIKISHRLNQAGRMDFVELKFLRSLHPPLDGELRKLLLVKGYQDRPRDWHEAEACVLRILPRELIFLFQDIFRCPKADVLAWLLNIGHGLVSDLLADLRLKTSANGHLAVRQPESFETAQSQENGSAPASNQLGLTELVEDSLALAILEKASELEASVEEMGESEAVVRYGRNGKSSFEP